MAPPCSNGGWIDAPRDLVQLLYGICEGTIAITLRAVRAPSAPPCAKSSHNDELSAVTDRSVPAQTAGDRDALLYSDRGERGPPSSKIEPVIGNSLRLCEGSNTRSYNAARLAMGDVVRHGEYRPTSYWSTGNLLASTEPRLVSPYRSERRRAIHLAPAPSRGPLISRSFTWLWSGVAHGNCA